MKNLFQSKCYWEKAWIHHVETYLSSPSRCGYWMESMFSKNLSVVEIAGGSCRDSRYLAEHGCQAVGTDFDGKTLEYLTKRFPNSKLPLIQADAFNLSFSDKEFDISFSNGFLVCFSQDKDIRSLLKEQERITRRYIVLLVHNKDNTLLVDNFREKSKYDPLYKIRFFTREELRQIIDSASLNSKNITFHKFGGKADALFQKKIKKFPNILVEHARFIAPRLYKYQFWSTTERIACVVELEK